MLLKVLPLVAVALILSAVAYGVLVFVLGIGVPGRPPLQPPGPPTVAFVWVSSDNLPLNSTVLTPEDLMDYQDVVAAARLDGNGTIALDQSRYDSLERLLDGRCMQAYGRPCIHVLQVGTQYYIMLLM